MEFLKVVCKMISKEKYIGFCENNPNIGLYAKPWWLDVCCGEKNWNVSVVEKNDEIIAALPFYIKSRKGLKYITVPPRTQTCGLYIKYPTGIKYQGKLNLENETIDQIINDIEEYAENNKIVYYQQSFSPELTNWTPFYRRNYLQTTKYTYRFEKGFTYEEAWGSYSSGLKNEVKKARKLLSVRECEDVDLMYQLYLKTMERKSLDSSYSKQFIDDFHSVCKNHNSCKLFIAEDEEKTVHGVLYIAFDDNWTNYLFGATDPENRKSNSSSLLIDSALQFSSENGLGFDFEGSVTPGVEEFFRKFGGKQTPYYSISKIFSKNPVIRSLLVNRLYNTSGRN